MTYEYHCLNCLTIFTEMRNIEDRKTDGVCPNCSGKGTYSVSTPFLKAYIDSDKWVKNRESHMKKEQKCLKEHGTYK